MQWQIHHFNEETVWQRHQCIEMHVFVNLSILGHCLLKTGVVHSGMTGQLAG